MIDFSVKTYSLVPNEDKPDEFEEVYFESRVYDVNTTIKSEPEGPKVESHFLVFDDCFKWVRMYDCEVIKKKAPKKTKKKGKR